MIWWIITKFVDQYPKCPLLPYLTTLTPVPLDELFPRFPEDTLSALHESEYVASMVLYLASEESRYATGVEFVVDDGGSAGVVGSAFLTLVSSPTARAILDLLLCM